MSATTAPVTSATAAPVNPVRHAVRTGLGRGWSEFQQSLRNPQDIGFYVFTGLGALTYLFLNRNSTVEGTDLLVPALAMPSIIGLSIAFGAIIGPAYTLSIEREDGTLLRSKAVPHGMTGYVTGQALFQSLGLLPMLVVVLVPSFFLFDGLMSGGLAGWLTVLWLIVLGLLATLPLGMIIGSLVKGPNKVGTWGMLPVIGLTAISGIFFPLSVLWGWVQVLAQVFPIYWLGLGMRSAFLPDAAAALEIGGSWRTLETVAVLGGWAVLGLLIVPVVLRRMARRESGSAVAARQQERMQRIG